MFPLYSAITFLAVFVLVIEIINMMNTSFLPGKRFITAFVMIILTTVCEWAGVALDGMDPAIWRVPHILVKLIEFSVAPCIPAILAAIYGHYGHKNSVALPIVLHFVLLCISSFNGFIFGVTADNFYYHGPCYFIYIAAYILSLLYMYICVLYYGKKEAYSNWHTLILILVFILAAVIIQMVNSSIRIDWMTVAIASCLLSVHFCTQEQQKLQEESEAARKDAELANSAKTSFLNRMSHDVRTPINGINGMVKIAEKNLGDEAVLKDCLKKIEVSSNHLLSLINDVLQVTKMESGKIEFQNIPFNLHELLADCRTIMAQPAAERSITITEDDEKHIECPYLIGSPLHVRQIFINIVGNCIKYNKVGGFIDIRSTVVAKTEDKITYRFTFSDTGIGMSPEFVKHIFEPFSREDAAIDGHYQGTGLGMSIVYQLITQMGGRIHVMSEKNVGSVFTIDLPFLLDKNPQVSQGKDRVDNTLSFEGKKVLVVEDNDLNTEIAVFMLKEYGLAVDCAQDGRAGLLLFKESEVGEYALILMDIMMPVMNGLEATGLIRGLDRPDAKTVPIVAMTANAFEEDRKASLSVGMNEHLSKPLEDADLHRVLKKYLT